MKKLSVPMQITLYALLRGEQPPYHSGQRRFIYQALFDRGLVNTDRQLTDSGRVEAQRIALEVKVKYGPGSG